MAEQIDTNMYTTPFQLTKTMHREPYDEILPSNPANTQKGKIIIITGAYGGVGSVSFGSQFLHLKKLICPAGGSISVGSGRGFSRIDWS